MEEEDINTREGGKIELVEGREGYKIRTERGDEFYFSRAVELIASLMIRLKVSLYELDEELTRNKRRYNKLRKEINSNKRTKKKRSLPRKIIEEMKELAEEYL